MASTNLGKSAGSVLTATDVNSLLKFDGSDQVGIGTTSPDVDLEVEKSSVGSSVEIKVQNTDESNTGSNAVLSATVGSSAGGTSGDPILQLENAGVASWYVNMDNSDSDKLKIGTSVSDSKLVIDTSGNVGIGSSSPVSTLEISESVGDPSITWSIGGTDKFHMGVDDSDSDNMKIGTGSTVGSNTYMQFLSAGGIAIQQDIVINDDSGFLAIGRDTTNQTISAGGIINPANQSVVRVTGDSGAVSTDTTTPITNGTHSGQIIIVIGSHDTNTVTLKNSGNCTLANADFVIGNRDTITLIWVTGSNEWFELSRSNNNV